MESGDRNTMNRDFDDNDSLQATPSPQFELSKLIADLQAWKELVLLINNLLTWQKQWYSYCIAAAVTVIFAISWYIEPSILTTIACIGMFLSLVDYVVPQFGAKLLAGKNWNAEQDKAFEKVCQSLLDVRARMGRSYSYIMEQRSGNPLMFSAIRCAILFTIGFLGYTINNTLLFYLSTLLVSLLPGLLHHNIIQQALTDIIQIYNVKFGQSKNK